MYKCGVNFNSFFTAKRMTIFQYTGQCATVSVLLFNWGVEGWTTKKKSDTRRVKELKLFSQSVSQSINQSIINHLFVSFKSP